MTIRKRLRSEKSGSSGQGYFITPTGVRFLSSGCALLDCVLGGGYALGKVVNIVGDKSTGKTLLAIEACANFAQEHPKASIIYNEVEAAFDRGYAAALGLPVDRVTFTEGCFTIEDVFEDLVKVIDSAGKEPVLYVLDSLDALSDRAELGRAMDEGTYGLGKAKQLSQLFRRLIQQLSGSLVTIIFISQVRDNIGVMFGEKTSRSGGRSLDFYASQVIYLSQSKQLKRTRKGIERPVGVEIRARCKKNKVGLPFRECEFPILFAFGVDDVAAGIAFLKKTGRLNAIGIDTDKAANSFLRGLDKLDQADYDQERRNVADAVKEVWRSIETSFLPSRRKYCD